MSDGNRTGHCNVLQEPEVCDMYQQLMDMVLYNNMDTDVVTLNDEFVESVTRQRKFYSCC